MGCWRGQTDRGKSIKTKLKDTEGLMHFHFSLPDSNRTVNIVYCIPWITKELGFDGERGWHLIKGNREKGVGLHSLCRELSKCCNSISTSLNLGFCFTSFRVRVIKQTGLRMPTLAHWWCLPEILSWEWLQELYVDSVGRTELISHICPGVNWSTVIYWRCL